MMTKKKAFIADTQTSTKELHVYQQSVNRSYSFNFIIFLFSSIVRSLLLIEKVNDLVMLILHCFHFSESFNVHVDM